MAKKHVSPPNEERKSAAEYYRLKTQAVDDLIHASEENSPEVTKDELEKFGAKKKSRVPEWVKVVFIKFWFPAAVYFFMVMGLGLWNPVDQIIILGIVEGMVTDLLMNPLLRMRAKPEGGNDRFMMFAKKRYQTFFLNMIYACALCFVVLCAYAGADKLINFAARTQNVKYLMGEPVTFGFFYMSADMLFLAARNFFARRLGSLKGQEG